MDTESRKIVEFLVFFRDSALKAIRPDDWKKQGPIHLHNFRKPPGEKNFKKNLTCQGKTAIFGLRQRGNEEEKPSVRGPERTPEAGKESAEAAVRETASEPPGRNQSKSGRVLPLQSQRAAAESLQAGWNRGIRFVSHP